MAETFKQLGHLFVQTIPTVIFVFFLLLILDRIFFRPVSSVLKKREEATVGALARAREQAGLAETKAREYGEAFQAARQEIYRLREAERRAALTEREGALRKAREQSELFLKDAQAGLAAETAAAKQELSKTCQGLAQEITEALLTTEPTGRGGVRA